MIPITEDELTDTLMRRMFDADRKAGVDVVATQQGRLEKARRLARLMVAAEQMYEALKDYSAATDFQYNTLLDSLQIEQIDEAKEKGDSALSAAEGRK